MGTIGRDLGGYCVRLYSEKKLLSNLTQTDPRRHGSGVSPQYNLNPKRKRSLTSFDLPIPCDVLDENTARAFPAESQYFHASSNDDALRAAILDGDIGSDEDYSFGLEIQLDDDDWNDW